MGQGTSDFLQNASSELAWFHPPPWDVSEAGISFLCRPTEISSALLKRTCWAGNPLHSLIIRETTLRCPIPSPLSAAYGLALFPQTANAVIRFKNASDSFGLSRLQVGVCEVKNGARVNDSLSNTALISLSLLPFLYDLSQHWMVFIIFILPPGPRLNLRSILNCGVCLELASETLTHWWRIMTVMSSQSWFLL